MGGEFGIPGYLVCRMSNVVTTLNLALVHLSIQSFQHFLGSFDYFVEKITNFEILDKNSPKLVILGQNGKYFRYFSMFSLEFVILARRLLYSKKIWFNYFGENSKMAIFGQN